MKTLNIFFTKKGNAIIFLLLFFLCIQLTSSAQTVIWTTPTITGGQIQVRSNLGAVCGSGVSGGYFDTWSDDAATQIQQTFNTVPQTDCFRAVQGETVLFRITGSAGNLAGLNWEWETGDTDYYVGTDGGAGGFVNPQYVSVGSGSFFDRFINITFPQGSMEGYFVIRLTEIAGSNIVEHQIVVPYIVEGFIADEVPFIGTTTVPEIPFLILHTPPGDMSSSSFKINKRVCRSFEDTYTVDSSEGIEANVKLGVSGSFGAFITLNFEAYVEFQNSSNTGSLRMQTTSEESCLEVDAEFFTSDLITGPEESGDVFIGYGRDLGYAIGENVTIFNCEAFIDSSLVFVPIDSSESTFAYKTGNILSEIASLTITANDTSLSDKAQIEAQNQIDVWNQVLALNAANRANATESMGGMNFTANVGQTHSESITTSTVSEIVVEQYFESTDGIEFLIEFAGSGGSGGVESTFKKRFGESQNQTAEGSKLIEYTLLDDDGDGIGDSFEGDIKRDPMYGTPIFKLDQANSRTSCPYQGGYQRDQPSLAFHNTTDDHITISNVALGTAAIIELDFCNDSNEPRDYTLKLNPNSNSNGAVVTVGGLPLNNAFGQTYTLNASACHSSNPFVVEVTRNSTNSPLEFPNLEFLLESTCEEDIVSSVFASVYFEGACPTDFAGNNRLMGNVSTNATYETDGSLESEQTILAPAQVDYDSQTEIDLLPGFEVLVGAEFHAYIDGCNN
jgi:hypothetical protein